MFDIGWSELLILAVVAIIVVGPKDLPKLLHTVGRYVAQIRRMASDFQRQFDDAIRDSELNEIRESVDDLKNLNPVRDIENSIHDIKSETTDFSLDRSDTATGSSQSAAVSTEAQETAGSEDMATADDKSADNRTSKGEA